MPLNLFYTMVPKSQKWPKTQIKGGPALKRHSPHRPFSQLRMWPRKKPRERQCRAKDLAWTANLQSFRMEKQEMASLSASFFRL